MAKVFLSVILLAIYFNSAISAPQYSKQFYNRKSRQDYVNAANYQSFAYPYNIPRYSENYTNPVGTFNDNNKYLGGASVNCGKIEVSPGVFNFDCSNVNPSDITLKNEHVVGLVANGGVQEINIPVKNYKIEEFIRGAIKSEARLRTLVNVLLQKPESLYNVDTAQDNKITIAEPDVNIRYEGVSPVARTFHHNSDTSRYLNTNSGNTGIIRPADAFFSNQLVAAQVPAFGLSKRMVMVNGKRY